MSGGHFEYIQHHYAIQDAIGELKFQIAGNPDKFSSETIEEYKKGLELLQKAMVYLNRIDYLISSDDGESEFHERLKEDLEKLNT